MKSKKLSRKQKRRSITSLLVFILLSPYIVGFADDDSSYSQLMIAAGGGQYVYHDCSGAHKQKFSDAGFYYGKKFEGPYRLGISASVWELDKKEYHILGYPDLALDWKDFSIGTTGIRLGSLDEFYVEAKSLDQPPYLSGKGILRLGVGGRLEKPFSQIWIGTNVIPYNDIGFATQLEFPWDENRFIFINGRFGRDRESNYEEYGISAGLRIVSF